MLRCSARPLLVLLGTGTVMVLGSCTSGSVDERGDDSGARQAAVPVDDPASPFLGTGHDEPREATSVKAWVPTSPTVEDDRVRIEPFEVVDRDGEPLAFGSVCTPAEICNPDLGGGESCLPVDDGEECLVVDSSGGLHVVRVIEGAMTEAEATAAADLAVARSR